jgi:hypothetical protein
MILHDVTLLQVLPQHGTILIDGGFDAFVNKSSHVTVWNELINTGVRAYKHWCASSQTLMCELTNTGVRAHKH